MNDLTRAIQSDLYRYTGETGISSFFSAYMRSPGFRFTYFLRKVAHYSSKKKSLGVFPYTFYRLLLNHYRFKYGFDISPTTAIGPGLYIGHFGGVIINPGTVIGSNVNIAHGVTIGASNRGRTKGVPTLGDRVWVGAGAIIVGNVTIGDDALIGAGAYINRDVPARAVVLGNPGMIVSNAGSAGYVNNVLGVPNLEPEFAAD